MVVLVSPSLVYGDDLDEFMNFFQMKINILEEYHAVVFKDLIYSHIRKVQSNPVTILPPFEEDIPWLNTSRPLDFKFDLQNKIYIIDFFTYCCINCLHILPLLKTVEAEFENDQNFAVIGIHSPKFPNEKNTERLKDALMLNDIKHPVMNDFKCLFWKKYGLTCWPTVFIVGPQNMVLFILIGEKQIEKVPFICRSVVDYYKIHGEKLEMNEVPVMPIEKPLDMPLFFPCNVSSNGELIAVSDTGHNRILVMSSKLEVQIEIGSSRAGWEDGFFDEASFNGPHGTTWYENTILVADTGNHSIRQIDFISEKVTTIFKVSDVQNIIDVEVVEQTFKSPWDVCIGPALGSDLKKLNVLYIAVAGSHQIWSFYLETNFCAVFAGSGREENRQNFYRLQAGFAQPSGITYSEVIPEFLFVADSESSTIKSISLIDGCVKIVVGGNINPMDLFSFGDEDGRGRNVKLQHPMSVCVIDYNLIAIADTYNHKIKLVELDKKSCSTFAPRDFYDLCEPSSICTVDEKLIVADTNNHRIIFFRIPTLISHLLWRSSVVRIDSFNTTPNCATVTKIRLRLGGEVRCFFSMDKHPRYSLTSLNSPWEVSFEGNCKCRIQRTLAHLYDVKNISAGTPPIVIKGDTCSLIRGYSKNSQCIVTFTINTQLCDELEKVCHIRDLTFKVEIHFTKFGAKEMELNFRAAIFDLFE